MALFDLPLDDLRTFRPEVAEPADFDEFWRGSIDEVSQIDLAVKLKPFENHQKLVDAYDLSFAGWGGTRVRAWLLVPTATTEPRPAVVSFIGYAGGREFPFATPFTGAGHVHLIMDTRGQGWNHFSLFERTPDSDPGAGLNSWPGVMTRGIGAPHTYYYRRLFLDCLRAVQVAKSLPQVDASQVFVEGGSQGGGLSIATSGLAALADVSLAGAMIDVPFLCHFARGITITDALPYKEISNYIRTSPHQEANVLRTLSYFDGVNFARRADIPAIFSVALMDMVCPPSTVFAAYNAWGSDHEESSQTEMNVYTHSGHEGGGPVQRWQQLIWLEALTGS